MSLLRTRAALGHLIHVPYAGDTAMRGAVCMTCGRIVDEEALVEGYPGESTFARYLVRHHGAEELRTFDMGSQNWDVTDLQTMVGRTNWFDPTSHEGLGLGVKGFAGEHDDKEDGEFKVFVGGGR